MDLKGKIGKEEGRQVFLENNKLHKIRLKRKLEKKNKRVLKYKFSKNHFNNHNR